MELEMLCFPQLALTDCQPPPGLESFYSLVGPGGGGWAGLGQERNTIIVLIDIKFYHSQSGRALSQPPQSALLKFRPNLTCHK